MQQYSQYRGPRRKERERAWEKFEEITVENFPNMRKEILTQPQEMQSPIQDKTKEEHAETHINQTDQN